MSRSAVVLRAARSEHSRALVTHVVSQPPRPEVRRGVLEPVIAPEQLVADRQRRHTEHTALEGCIGRGAEHCLDLRIGDRTIDRAGGKSGALGSGQRNDGSPHPRARRSISAMPARRRP